MTLQLLSNFGKRVSLSGLSAPISGAERASDAVRTSPSALKLSFSHYRAAPALAANLRNATETSHLEGSRLKVDPSGYTWQREDDTITNDAVVRIGEMHVANVKGAGGDFTYSNQEDSTVGVGFSMQPTSDFEMGATIHLSSSIETDAGVDGWPSFSDYSDSRFSKARFKCAGKYEYWDLDEPIWPAYYCAEKYMVQIFNGVGDMAGRLA